VSKQSKRERQRLNREARREYEERLARRRKTWRTVRTFAIILVPILIVGIILSVTSGGSEDEPEQAAPSGCAEVEMPPAKDVSFPGPPEQTISSDRLYTATIDTTCGEIEALLFAQDYPISANNFVFLAREGFYDDLAVVRAATDFVVQAGSPTQSNDGGPGYTVQGEVPTPAAGQTAYPEGTLAWAKTGSEPAGTIGSQFFVVTGDASQLPPEYAVLGTVTKGLGVARRIEELAPASGDGPTTRPVVMRKVTITEEEAAPVSTAPPAT
jgi:cyclophilin family peptidyl-prolyl cis-trans isomerase